MSLKFKSQAAEDVVMLQVHAQQVLQVIGRDANQPGVLEVKDLPTALALLKGLPDPTVQPSDPDDEDDPSLHRPEEPVSLRHRAWPLIKMVERSLAAQQPVTWGVLP
ncbi:MAG: DUF1840 domain-containing protein [Burkholderiales bacterium]|nr:DUF1840 domain-containing protein [Burkholderiales bacterium]